MTIDPKERGPCSTKTCNIRRAPRARGAADFEGFATRNPDVIRKSFYCENCTKAAAARAHVSLHAPMFVRAREKADDRDR